MFGYAAFAELPFATIGISVVPPTPTEILLGGHFGFDERDKRWEQEKKLEAQRKKKLHEVIFGLPPEIREKISTAPEQTIEIAAQTTIDYDALMLRVRELDKRIKLERDEQDISRILELL
jgi:hypothetical protein